MARKPTDDVQDENETTDDVQDENETTDDVQEPVTFKALAAQDQVFRVGGAEHAFRNGLFTTSDAYIIDFLDNNHAATRIPSQA